MSSTRQTRASTRAVIGLVAGREIRERLRTKSFAILTGLLVVIIVGIGVVNRVAGSDGPDTIELGIVGATPGGLVDALVADAQALDRKVELVEVADPAAPRAAVDDGDLDVALLGDEQQLVFSGSVDPETNAIVQQAWSTAAVRDGLVAEGLGPDRIDAVLAPPPLTAITIDDSGRTGLAVLTGTVAAVLLFMSLQTFGGYVLIGVVEEKSSAVIELLLARVRADQLLAGKILGIGVVALIQFASSMLAGLAALAISGVDVPTEIWTTLPLTVLWFLGGYVFYSTLFALAGSLVSRQEDAQAASAPIMSAMIGAYILVFVFGYMPESTVSRVMSVIPPIAPFLMPMRMAAGAASVVEIVVAGGLLILATAGVWKLASRIYEQMVLRQGTRISWRAAISSARRTA